MQITRILKWEIFRLFPSWIVRRNIPVTPCINDERFNILNDFFFFFFFLTFSRPDSYTDLFRFNCPPRTISEYWFFEFKFTVRSPLRKRVVNNNLILLVRTAFPSVVPGSDSASPVSLLIGPFRICRQINITAQRRTFFFFFDFYTLNFI